MSRRFLPPSRRPEKSRPETAWTIEPFAPVPGAGTNPMVFIDRLKGNNHVVTTEIPHTVFLVFENDDISRMVFHSADSPGAMDRAIRSLVPQKVNGRRIVAVVTFAES